MPIAGFSIRQNSLLPTLVVTPKASGQLIPWTAGTTATVRMDGSDGFASIGPTIIADRACIAQNDGSGNLQLGITWQAGDTATAGWKLVTFKVDVGGAAPQQEWPVGTGAPGFWVLIEPTLTP